MNPALQQLLTEAVRCGLRPTSPVVEALVRLHTRVEELEAVMSVSPVESCRQERAEGNGGCGACADCCQRWREKLWRTHGALSDLYEYTRKRYPPKMGGDQYPPSLKDIMHKAQAALEEDT